MHCQSGEKLSNVVTLSRIDCTPLEREREREREREVPFNAEHRRMQRRLQMHDDDDDGGDDGLVGKRFTKMRRCNETFFTVLCVVKEKEF